MDIETGALIPGPGNLSEAIAMIAGRKKKGLTFQPGPENTTSPFEN
jgi:hypothetical protein